MKKTTKTTTKKVKFAVDITDLNSPMELYKRIADAKQKAGIALSDGEYRGLKNFYIENAMTIVVLSVDTVFKPVFKKTPWYKKLWNKIFKRNKK